MGNSGSQQQPQQQSSSSSSSSRYGQPGQHAPTSRKTSDPSAMSPRMGRPMTAASPMQTSSNSSNNNNGNRVGSSSSGGSGGGGSSVPLHPGSTGSNGSVGSRGQDGGAVVSGGRQLVNNQRLGYFEAPSPPAFGSPLDTPSFLDFPYGPAGSGMSGSHDGRGGSNNGNGGAIPDPVSVAMLMEDDLANAGTPLRGSSANARREGVPTVFRWHRGGKNVYVTGTFNGWKGRIPLNKSHDEFTTIVELPPGTHQYKFIVDDEWMFNPDQPTVPDPYGAMNNMVDVLPPDSMYEIESDPTALSSSPPGDYGQEMPPMEYGAKPPPVLPPHLLQVILNADPVSEDDPTRLPVPNHVMLNHLYALSIKDGVMVLGVTHRFRKKYITTVLYRCV